MRHYVHFAGLLAIAIPAMIGIYAVAAAEPPSSPGERIVREAIEGKFSEFGTGNGMFDDMIGVIKDNGSVLDNSSLDPRVLSAQTDEPGDSESRNAYAAEQLLKASRWLQRVGSADKERANLVNRMRAEAVKLLSE